MNRIRSVCVYCGSSPGRDPAYLKAGQVLGRSIAKAGLTLVYGGGTKGIMGAVSDGARRAGGQVTGIIPRFLVKKEASEPGLNQLSEIHITENMHERKHMMFERSDAFVALPGGIGTVEEIVEVMTWGQLGHHRKPIVFGNIGGFWDPFFALFDHMRKEGFIHAGHLVNPILVADPEAIVPAILAAAAADGAPAEGVESVIDKL
ncbi:MAG TPA: TIGR00730 family Rossman fold protein [Rhizobiaceae bacterium]|nr:TIGR00730 family Rossman fold protein [Rhizobiaceae bacterium]